MPIFVELSLIIFIAAAFALAARFFRQPLLVGYIAAGVLVGPYVLNIFQATGEVELFSKIGIAILLFVVGLNLNPDVAREVGRVSVFLGLGQVIFTSFVGYFIFSWLGFSHWSALYGAIALTFSSTIIVLKLLSDKGAVGNFYGKLSIGMLLVQDLVATVVLVVVVALGPAGTAIASAPAAVFTLLAEGCGLALILYLISKYVLPHLTELFADSQELLFVFSIAWGLGLASLFYVVGFSIEIGALIAGVTLAASPFAYEISSRLRPLRDFFVLLFFVLLGVQISPAHISSLIGPAIVLSLFVLIGNPLIVITLLRLQGYRSRTSFLVGITVAQISEFSLILVALGLSLGRVGQDLVSLITLVGIITITISSYLILHAEAIYRLINKLTGLLTWSGRREGKRREVGPEIVIFGYDRVGHEFVTAAQKITDNYLVIDFNPTSIKRLQSVGVPFRYGDAEDVEFLQEVGVTRARLVISTIPDFKTNLSLVGYYRKHNRRGIIIAISHDVRQAKELYAIGASYVVMPHYLGARHASDLIQKNGLSAAKFARERQKHMNRLVK